MKQALCLALLALLAACQPSDDGGLHGYVEGDYVLIAPTSAGILQTLSVAKGQSVQPGDPLFTLDLTALTAKRAAAAAQLHKAEAELNDLTKGDRPEEIEVIKKQKDQAKARLVNAQKEYNRILPLSKKGSVSASVRDNAKAELDSTRARLKELEARLKSVQLGARPDRIEAAQAVVEAMTQDLALAEQSLKEAAPLAVTAGRVEDTYFHPGEFVAAGQPVVKILPPGQVKVRFYVPQATVATLRRGQAVTVRCDGCAAPVAAKINYIASQSEYTPPVIYSVESRQKLVFLVEAVPDQFDPALHPGLPVSLDLGPQP